jgi:hypothetical protein
MKSPTGYPTQPPTALLFLVDKYVISLQMLKLKWLRRCFTALSPATRSVLRGWRELLIRLIAFLFSHRASIGLRIGKQTEGDVKQEAEWGIGGGGRSISI